MYFRKITRKISTELNILGTLDFIVLTSTNNEKKKLWVQ